MSGTPLDRIRRQAGVVGRPPRTSPAPSGHVVHHRAAGLDAILAARRGRPADLRELRLPAAIAAALALATVLGHLKALEWAAQTASHENLFVYQWLVDILTFGNSQQWAPPLAALAVVGLLGSCIWTHGFRDGQLPAVVASGASLTGAGVAAVPLAVATVVAVVALAVAVALVIVLVVLCLFMLFAALSSSLE